MAHCYFSRNTYLGIIIANQSQLFNISNASCKSDVLSVEDYPFMQQLSAYSVPGTVLGPGIKQ